MTNAPESQAPRPRGASKLLAGLIVVGMIVFQSPLLGAQVEPSPSPVAEDGGPGIQVNRKDVLFGNPLTSTTPAELDLDSALAATPEGQQIEAEGIERGSARYNILLSKAHARVRRVVKDVAVATSRDCVVKLGSILKNPHNLDVYDITADVISALGSG